MPSAREIHAGARALALLKVHPDKLRPDMIESWKRTAKAVLLAAEEARREDMSTTSESNARTLETYTHTIKDKLG